MTNLENVRERIRQACGRAGRRESEITLVAVSKTKSWHEVASLLGEGQTDFGENYVQEALGKIEAGRSAGGSEIRWHFVGGLQSNKAKFIPGNFTLFHALESLSTAQKLNKAAAAAGVIQECLVEVNVDEEPSKGGLRPEYLVRFLEEVKSHPALSITGLMCIPTAPMGGSSRGAFARLRELMATVNSRGVYPHPLVKLSMGMSADYEEAISEGATLVRVGTALFGKRQQ